MLDLGITCSINATVELPTFAYQKQDCMQIAVEDRVSQNILMPHPSAGQTQRAEWTLNKIEITLNGTFAG